MLRTLLIPLAVGVPLWVVAALLMTQLGAREVFYGFLGTVEALGVWPLGWLVWKGAAWFIRLGE